jgi:hypothetical protein
MMMRGVEKQKLDDGHQRAARRVKDDGRTRDEFPTPGPRSATWGR